MVKVLFKSLMGLFQFAANFSVEQKSPNAATIHLGLAEIDFRGYIEIIFSQNGNRNIKAYTLVKSYLNKDAVKC
jgi:hypothetical protein